PAPHPGPALRQGPAAPDRAHAQADRAHHQDEPEARAERPAQAEPSGREGRAAAGQQGPAAAPGPDTSDKGESAAVRLRLTAAIGASSAEPSPNEFPSAT